MRWIGHQGWYEVIECPICQKIMKCIKIKLSHNVKSISLTQLEKSLGMKKSRIVQHTNSLKKYGLLLSAREYYKLMEQTIEELYVTGYRDKSGKWIEMGDWIPAEDKELEKRKDEIIKDMKQKRMELIDFKEKIIQDFRKKFRADEYMPPLVKMVGMDFSPNYSSWEKMNMIYETIQDIMNSRTMDRISTYEDLSRMIIQIGHIKSNDKQYKEILAMAKKWNSKVLLISK